MFKLIALLAVAIPVLLFIRSTLLKRSPALQKALADFRKQVDYLAWGILVLVACVIVYSVGKLVYAFWR